MKRPLHLRFPRSIHICRRCIASLSAAATRRPNGALKGPSWHLPFKPATVFFYGGIMTMAASADAQTKRDRLKQWEDAIGSVEAELLAMDIQQQKLPERGPHRRNDISVLAPFESNSDLSTNRFGFKLNEDTAVMIATRVMKRIMFPESALLPDDKSAVSPRSIYARDHQEEFAKPFWTPKKAAIHELALARLGMRLFQYAYRDRTQLQEPDLICTFAGVETLDQLQYTVDELEHQCIEATRSETFHVNMPRPQVPRYNHSLRSTEDLDMALLALVRESKEGNISSECLAEKMAYNLLVSATPPYISTLTILISQLSRLGHYELADLAVETMYTGLVRPNEQLVSVCLNHFVRSGSPRHFDLLSEKLRGRNGGLMTARSDVTINETNAHRLIRKGSKVIQAMRMTPKLYEEIGDGYLKQGGIRRGEFWLNQMFLEGCTISLSLLSQLLEGYVRTKDYKAAFTLWEDMMKWFSEHDLVSDFKADATACFRYMLAICKDAGKIKEYQDTYRQARIMGFSANAVLEAPLTESTATEVDEELEEVRLKTHIISQRLQWIRENADEWTLQLYVSKVLLCNRPMVWIARYFSERLNTRAKQHLIKARKLHEKLRLDEAACESRAITNFFQKTPEMLSIELAATTNDPGIRDITQDLNHAISTLRTDDEEPEAFDAITVEESTPEVAPVRKVDTIENIKRAVASLTDRIALQPYEVRRTFHQGRTKELHPQSTSTKGLVEQASLTPVKSAASSTVSLADNLMSDLPPAASEDRFLRAIVEEKPLRGPGMAVLTPYVITRPLVHKFNDTLSYNPLKQMSAHVHKRFENMEAKAAEHKRQRSEGSKDSKRSRKVDVGMVRRVASRPLAQ